MEDFMGVRSLTTERGTCAHLNTKLKMQAYESLLLVPSAWIIRALQVCRTAFKLTMRSRSGCVANRTQVEYTCVLKVAFAPLTPSTHPPLKKYASLVTTVFIAYVWTYFLLQQCRTEQLKCLSCSTTLGFKSSSSGGHSETSSKQNLSQGTR